MKNYTGVVEPVTWNGEVVGVLLQYDEGDGLARWEMQRFREVRSTPDGGRVASMRRDTSGAVH